MHNGALITIVICLSRARGATTPRSGSGGVAGVSGSEAGDRAGRRRSVAGRAEARDVDAERIRDRDEERVLRGRFRQLDVLTHLEVAVGTAEQDDRQAVAVVN